MPVAYYLTPFGLLFAKGGGRFGLSEPGRPVVGSRCLIYAAWDQAQGTRCSSIAPSGPKGTGKPLCISRVDAPDGVHTAIQADAAIWVIPITTENRETTFGQLQANARNQVTNRMDQYGFDSSWIVSETTLRAILVYILSVSLCVRVLGTDYPDVSLNTLVSALPGNQFSAILTFLAGRGIPTADIISTSTVRDLVRKFGQVSFGRIVMGAEEFIS